MNSDHIQSKNIIFFAIINKLSVWKVEMSLHWLNHSVITFDSAQSDPIKQRALYNHLYLFQTTNMSICFVFVLGPQLGSKIRICPCLGGIQSKWSKIIAKSTKSKFLCKISNNITHALTS